MPFSNKSDPKMDNKKNTFWPELKRRNIFRVATVYLIVGWIIIQIGDAVFEPLDLPNWALTLLILMVVLGFPLALILAWAYEMSPQGMVSTSSQESKENPYSKSRRKPLTSNLMIGILIILVVAQFLYFKSNKVENYNSKESSINQVERSIAVLPFKDMSEHGDQEYFSDGISDEILNALARIPNLKVTGRTSSFSFKEKDVTIMEIGDVLNVKTVLQGSVRKSGTTLRITAQLINAEDGFHLWSETYDRELVDIFAIQDEITLAIVNALKIHLIKDDGIIKSNPINIEAYSTYLKARQKLATRGINNLTESRDLFYKVIKFDSTYAPAYAGLGRVLSLLVNYSTGDLTLNDSYGLAIEAANKAISLDANNGEAYSVLGTVKSWYNWDWVGADNDFRKSLELNPNDAETYNFAGDYYRIVYHSTLAMEMESKALELDPLHAINHWDLAFVYVQLGDWENSLKYIRNGLKLNNSLITYIQPLLFETYGKLGHLEEIENIFKNHNTVNTRETKMLSIKTMFALAKGKNDLALTHLKTLEKFGEQGIYSSAFLANFYIQLEMYDRAAYWIEKAYQNHDVYMIFESRITLPEHLSDHPALQAAIDKPEWNALYEIRRRNQKLNTDTP